MVRNRRMVVFLAAVMIAGAVFAENLQSSPVQCTGRTGQSSEGNPVLYWPGSAVQAHFKGTSLSVVLDDQKGEAFYHAIIDGKDDNPVVLAMKPGKHTYAVASNLRAGTHEVVLFRRTEGLDGPTEFRGFILDDGATLLAPPTAPKRKIEFYGDSITCGMGNEAPDDGKDDVNSERNNYLAYGAVTARELGAEYRCIARSGIGIIKSWFDLEMPDYWYRLDPQDANSRWDFTQWTPDVVVVNLFQNDSWLVGKMNPPPSEEQIIQAYIDFISGIRKVYPKAHIVCALGRMDATLPKSPWPGYIHQAVVRMHDSNMSEQVFRCTEFHKHPRVRHHREMADQLTRHIRHVMRW